MISKNKFHICIICVSAIILMSLGYYYYNRHINQHINKKDKKLIIENFDTTDTTDNSNNLLTNGSFSANQNINQNISSSGSNLIVKYRNNPGSSPYVLQQQKTKKSPTIFYEISVPVKKNTQYNLSFWVAFIGNKKPINYSSLIHVRTPKSDSHNYIHKPIK